MIPLQINNISKTFKNSKGEPFQAVKNISFEIEQGKIFGLLGPNGAGKSTLINIISGILQPDSGTVNVFGLNVVAYPDKTKKLIGVVPQEVVGEMAFTVKEVLYYFAGMYGVSREERNIRIPEILKELNLEDKMESKARNLSGGMKRRLMIAKAMIHRPKFLILDEPTAGVDVSLRQKIWQLVRRLNDEGTTILFTTHYLEEAEQLCESIVLIDHGQVIKSGRLKDIQREFSQNVIHFELFDRSVKHIPGVSEIGNEYEYPMTNLGNDMALLTKYYDGNLKSIRSESASLEQVFLKLTNKN